MNTTIKKIVKGTLAIFAIKLIILCGLFVFQSCQSENQDNEELQIAKNSFLTVLNKSNESLNSLKTSKQTNKGDNTLNKSEIQLNTYEVCITDLSSSSTTQEDIINDIDDLSDLIEATNNGLVSSTNQLATTNDESGDGDETSNNTEQFNPEDCDAIIEVEAQPINDALHPAVLEARNYLISSYGYTNQEIDNMILDENGQEEDLIPLVMTMVTAENNNNSAFNYTSFFINSTYALTDWEQIGQCALVAIGADVLFSLTSESGGTKWKKKGIKKAFGAVAKRMLGPIGVAIAVVSFAMCMGGLN